MRDIKAKVYNKPMTEEEAKKEYLFSITKYLDACHKNNKEPSNEIMEHVDFTEVGSKHIISYHPKHGQFNDYVEESIAENCIAHLPFEAYEKFITADWINFSAKTDKNIASRALSRKNISLLERLHDLGVEKALADKDFIHTYSRDYIQKIYQIGQHLNIEYGNRPESHDFNERFLKLIRKAVSEHDYFMQLNYVNKKPKKLVYKKSPNWIKDCAWFSQSYSEGLEKSLNKLFSSLASSDKYMLLFEDGLIQTAKAYPKDLRYILGIEPKENSKNELKYLDNILSIALKKDNLDAARMLINNFGLSEQDCFNAYSKNVEKDINQIKYEYTEDAPLFRLLTNNFTNTYRKAKDEFFPNLETDYLPLFLLGTDKELKNQLLENTQDIIHRKMPLENGISLYDSILLAKAVDTINNHLKAEDKSLKFSSIKDDCSGMTLRDVIAKHVFNKNKRLLKEVDYNSITIQDWNRLFENNSIADFLKVNDGQKTSKMELDDLKTIWQAAMLNTELSNSNIEKTKKIKL